MGNMGWAGAARTMIQSLDRKRRYSTMPWSCLIMGTCTPSRPLLKAPPQPHFLCSVLLRMMSLVAAMHLWARGGQAFPKSTEIRNSVAFRAVFSVFFRPKFFVVAESVSEQLLQRTGRLGGQFWLSKESVSTSATD